MMAQTRDIPPPRADEAALAEPDAADAMSTAVACVDADADEASATLLALLVDAAESEVRVTVPDRIHGVVVGRIVDIGATGPTVQWVGAPAGVVARSIAALSAEHVGREVALVFEQGDPARPLVMGVMERFEVTDAVEDAAAPETVATDATATVGLRVEAHADGERVVLEAERELVLSCGRASITLTRAGKILIRGAYVSSHATGVQRIRGGTVEIN